MNKYFLPVYHSDLKPWIKWWILKRLGGGESSLKAITISSGTLTKVDKSMGLSIKEYYGNTVQDGTPTPESPVEIKTISGDITFTINGGDYKLDLKSKQLFDENNVLNAYIDANGYVLTSNASMRVAYIECKPNTVYTITKVKSARFIIATYSSLDMGSSSTNGKNDSTASTLTILTNDSAKYLCVFYYHTSDTLSEQEIRNSIMINEGTTALPYESYYNYELCKIGNYKDKIYNDNGTWKIEKKVGKVVLNGTENWIKHGSIASWFYYDGVTNGYFNNAADNFALTNYFAQKSYSSVVNLTNGEFAYGSSDNGATHRLVCKDTNYTATQDFKTWLSLHNLNLYYVLATPSTETITNTNLISQLNALYEFYVNSSTVSISNNSEITLEVLLEYYGR